MMTEAATQTGAPHQTVKVRPKGEAVKAGAQHQAVKAVKAAQAVKHVKAGPEGCESWCEAPGRKARKVS